MRALERAGRYIKSPKTPGQLELGRHQEPLSEDQDRRRDLGQIRPREVDKLELLLLMSMTPNRGESTRVKGRGNRMKRSGTYPSPAR